MLIYIVRHGETRRNAEKRLAGHQEVPLNDTGRQQALQTAAALKDVKFDLVISSPSGRARETAGIIAGKREIPMLLDERLHEINWGMWDGLPNSGNSEQMAEEMTTFYREPMRFKGAPEGETLQSVLKRGQDFMRDLLSHQEWENKVILIATHACTVRGILNPYYKHPDEFWQEGVPANCSVSILEYRQKSPVLLEKDHIYYDASLRGNYYTLED